MYRVVVQDEAEPTVAALPADGLTAWFDVLDALETAPWSGDPVRTDNPEGNMRFRYFGPDSAGLVTYLILDRDREVHVVEVTWLG